MFAHELFFPNAFCDQFCDVSLDTEKKADSKEISFKGKKKSQLAYEAALTGAAEWDLANNQLVPESVGII